MIFIIILLSLILVISGIVFILAFFNLNNKDVTYSVMTGPDYDEYHDRMIDSIKKAVEIPYEEVYIESRDGLKLFGRMYNQHPNGPVHIQFHGYRDNGIKDYCGGLKIALNSGANALVIDQRAHGKSQGHVISFGIKERYDVLSWINYINERFGADTPIFLDGISMGAATVLMASDLDLPVNVKGIIADCPYSDPFKIIEKVATDYVHCPKILNPFVIISAFLFGRFNIFESSAEKSVAETKVPILLIHGTGDHFVPVEMSRSIYNANLSMITKVEVEGAPHGLSYMKDRELYVESITEFTEKCLKESRKL